MTKGCTEIGQEPCDDTVVEGGIGYVQTQSRLLLLPVHLPFGILEPIYFADFTAVATVLWYITHAFDLIQKG